MTLWQDLVAAALLGTERQALTLPPADDPLGSVLARIDQADQEHKLLGAAAAISLHQRAGQLPAADHRPQTEPCEPDDPPRCSARAVQHLSTMLEGTYRNVLPEWLAALAQIQRRVPEELLPALLDAGRRDTDLRALIIPVIGRRGSWLAARNHDWQYAINVDSDSEADWQTGSRTARTLVIQRLRATDPKAARDLLISTWSEESSDDCAAFLETFITGLSMDDEPFLESALDDRRKRVRAIAADLLARLPESRLSQRMIARVKPLLKYRKGLKNSHIKVTLPETCDATMIRDGIDPNPPKGKGEKAWWLCQMISAVPPSFWAAEWHTGPMKIRETLRSNEWGTAIMHGLVLATQRHQDREWADVLLHSWLEHHTDTMFERNNELINAIGQLTYVVPPSHLETLIIHKINMVDAPIGTKHPVYPLIQACKHQWSVELSRTVLLHLKGQNVNVGDLAQLERFALYISPTLVDEARNIFSDMEDLPYWKPAIERFLATLYFRYDMLKELNS